MLEIGIVSKLKKKIPMFYLYTYTLTHTFVCMCDYVILTLSYVMLTYYINVFVGTDLILFCCYSS